MIKIFILAVIGSLFAIAIFFIEDQVCKMSSENLFRKWWRKWIVSDDPRMHNNKIEP